MATGECLRKVVGSQRPCIESKCLLVSVQLHRGPRRSVVSPSLCRSHLRCTVPGMPSNKQGRLLAMSVYQWHVWAGRPGSSAGLGWTLSASGLSQGCPVQSIWSVCVSQRCSVCLSSPGPGRLAREGPSECLHFTCGGQCCDSGGGLELEHLLKVPPPRSGSATIGTSSACSVCVCARAHERERAQSRFRV